MATLLLSDLHLPTKASPLREAFVAFLEGPARSAEAVYILGDLFEYWVGDDVGLQFHAREISRLAALSASGVKLYLMHGNRDFMVGSDYAEITGTTLLHDPCVVDLYGTPTLLSHGDLWCTEDVRYQKWRRFSRRPLVQWLYLRLPRSTRERVAGNLRSQSGDPRHYKPENIMNVTDAAIESAFREYNVRRMIHGHTHRPAEHMHADDCERIVLADWRPERMEYIRMDAAGWQRVRL